MNWQDQNRVFCKPSQVILVLVVLRPQFGNSVRGHFMRQGQRHSEVKEVELGAAYFPKEKSIWWRIQVALVVKNPRANVQDVSKRPRFDPWRGKIPGRREWQPTPVFSPRESHG